MKQSYLMLSLLIPSPSSPKSSIYVYLKPLVDELKELWEKGFETYDASSKQYFNVRVALLRTVSDFPAYAMLSGWRTSGKLACPVCNYDTWSKYLSKSKKIATWVVVVFWTPIINGGKIRSVLMAMKNLKLLRFHY